MHLELLAKHADKLKEIFVTQYEILNEMQTFHISE